MASPGARPGGEAPPSPGPLRSSANFIHSAFSPLSMSADRQAAAARLRTLLDRVDDLLRGRSSHGTMTMRVVTPRFTRELTLEQWSRGKDQFLVRILEPKKERGTATLRSGQDIWNYLPKVAR